MPLHPDASVIPKIRRLLVLFRIAAMFTGFFLLGLVAMMIFRYGLDMDIEVGGQHGFIALAPKDQITGVNFSVFFLIVHGWLYVVYLFIDFALWRTLRFSFLRFLMIALGGVVPFLSFVFEFQVPRFVRREIAGLREQSATAP